MENSLLKTMDFSLARWKILQKLIPLILTMGDYRKFLQSFIAALSEVFTVRWASLATWDEGRGCYKICASFGRLAALAQGGLNPSIRQAPVWLEDRQRIVRERLAVEYGKLLSPELDTELGKSDTFVSLPLFAEDELVGIVNLGAKSNTAQFTKDELDVLGDLAPLFAALIKKAIDYAGIERQKLYQGAVLDNLVSGIIVVDTEGKIIVFNRAAERILKLKAEQVLGQDIRRFPDNLADLLIDTLEKGRSLRRQELRLLRANILIGASTSQFYDAKGKLLGACIVFCNLEQIHRQEQAAQQKDLRNNWSKVAQEIRSSLAGTKEHTELFPKEYEDAEFKWNLYSTLKHDLGKLDSFTQRIIDLAEDKPLSIQSCAIARLIDEAIDLSRQGKDIGKIVIERSYSKELKPLVCDYQQLRDAFRYIISNSLEAMNKQGRLHISIELEHGPEMLIYNLPEAVNELPQTEVITVKIQDSGNGISPQDLPRLFEPFFTTKEARSGLGLAIAKKTVERHQGLIRASSHLGEGATFWIYLPLLTKEDFICK